MSEGFCCGLYRGTFYAKDLSNPNAPLVSLGNAEATIAQSMTEIEQDNFESLGGKACSVSYVDSMSLDLVLHCVKPENLALAFMGTVGQKSEESITDEAHVVNANDELIPFENIPSKNYPIVVKNDENETLVEGTDYVLTSAGVKIISVANINLGEEILVSYIHGRNWEINAQTVAQKTFYIVLDGVNVGGDGQKPVVLKAWKVKFAPTESFALISGTEFASLNVTGEILRDDTKAVGSKFMKVEFGVESAGAY